MLLPKIRVENVIREKEKIVGVLAGGDELRADVVIACDGVLSLLGEQAGLHPAESVHNYAVGIKEVIALDPEKINDRFHLQGNEGAAHLFVGEVTKGIFGGGFLYTNKESVSLGIVIGIEDLMEKGGALEAPALMDLFKERPEIACLINGGATVEYAAHLIPEGGFKALHRLYGDGILVAGDAAGFALNMGFTVRGMEYALASGYYAAKTVLQAKRTGRFDAASLSEYDRQLKESFVGKDFQNFQATASFVNNPRFFSHYPEWTGKILKDIYNIPAGPKDRLYPTIRKYLGLREMWAMFQDFRKVRNI
jgi:electron transfer flavoprotein-quinone oxidoreductase